MKRASLASKRQKLEDLQTKVGILRSRLEEKRKMPNGDAFIRWSIEKSQARFERIRRPKEHDIGHGTFFLIVHITARKQAVYLPISIASSKKPTGFVYQIEGTAEGTISSTDISCRGDGVTKVTLGTLLYAKIPAGKTAAFRILVETRGNVGKLYKIVINRINYKLDPRDARYQRIDTAISSKTVKFR